MFLTTAYTTVGYDFTYIFLFLGIAVLSYIVQANLKRKFEQYSKMPIGLTGRDIAIKMLHDNGIYDVKVTSTPGMLTDHYNPATKTVNLSESVMPDNSVTSKTSQEESLLYKKVAEVTFLVIEEAKKIDEEKEQHTQENC